MVFGISSIDRKVMRKKSRPSRRRVKTLFTPQPSEEDDGLEGDFSARWGQPISVSTSFHHATTVLVLQIGRPVSTKLLWMSVSSALLVAQVYTCASVGLTTLYNPCATGTRGCRQGMWCSDQLAYNEEYAELLLRQTKEFGFGRCVPCGGWNDQTAVIVSQANFANTCSAVVSVCDGTAVNSTVACDPRAYIECTACSYSVSWEHVTLAKYRTLHEALRISVSPLIASDCF